MPSTATITDRAARAKVKAGERTIEVEAKEVYDGRHFVTRATCPYCQTMNEKPGARCEHYVKEVGGCGAYSFVFDRVPFK